MSSRPAVLVLTVMTAVAGLLVGPTPPARAQAIASITMPPPGATKALYEGCNNIALTFPNATPIMAVAAEVKPLGTLQTVWRHDAAQNRFEGFSPFAPAASDLLAVNFLDAVWLCLTPATLRPPALAPTGTPSATATPTPTPTLGYEPPVAIVVPLNYLDSFRYSLEMAFQAEVAFALTSTGAFRAPDRMSCTVGTRVLGFFIETEQLIVIGDDAWIDTGEGWTATSADDVGVAETLNLCPGSRAFWGDFHSSVDLSRLTGYPESKNGVPALRYSVTGLAQIPGLLGASSDMDGVAVRSYDLWLAQDGGWIVALDVSATLDSAPVDGDLGLEPLDVRMRVDVADPNNLDIQVEPPVP